MTSHSALRPVPTPGTVWTVDRLIPSEPWMAGAVCATTDPDLHFPGGYSRGYTKQIADARAVCASCPVVGDCLRYALEHREDEGIWGGTVTVTLKRAVIARDGGFCLMALPGCNGPAQTTNHRANRMVSGQHRADLARWAA